MIASRVASLGRCSRARSCLGPGGGSSAWLLLEKMIAEGLGALVNRAAKICAIMPPIDAPTMCAVSILEVVQQRRGVVGEILQRVDRRAAQPEERPDHPRHQRRAGVAAGHLARQADVAVVVADDAQALVDELLAETLAPQQQLRAEAHDEQDGGIVRVAHVLVVDVEIA